MVASKTMPASCAIDSMAERTYATAKYDNTENIITLLPRCQSDDEDKAIVTMRVVYRRASFMPSHIDSVFRSGCRTRVRVTNFQVHCCFCSFEFEQQESIAYDRRIIIYTYAPPLAMARDTGSSGSLKAHSVFVRLMLPP